MKKKVLTSLELYAVVNELSVLKGALVDKIYQISSKELLISFYKSGKGKLLLKIDSGHGLFLTKYSLEKPPFPSSFCMFLRKFLNRTEVTDIVQKDLERIIEINFKNRDKKYKLIFELFSKGNFILTDDKYKILNVANVQKWKTRTIKKGEKYEYPPFDSIDIFNLSYSRFEKMFESDKSVVRFLASNLGLGGIYAEEVCNKINIDKNKSVNKIPKKDAKEIYNALKDLLSFFENMHLSPGIIKEGEEIIEAVPLNLSIFDNYEPKSSWNEALDEYYTAIKSSKIKDKKEEKYNEAVEKLETVLEKQKEALETYTNKSERYFELGEKIYKKYDVISEIVNKLKHAISTGISIPELKEIVNKEKEEGSYEAGLIVDLTKDSVIIDLGEEIEFTFKESIEKVAEFFYEKSKNYKSKIPGAEKTIQRTLNKLNKLRSNEEEMKDNISQSLPQIKEQIKKKWYEKFHWFNTSSGKRVIGGRDATQNDILLKKHIEARDLIFHTLMPGSPFFILRKGEDASEKEINEVAIATASYSKAWKEGVSSLDVFYVRPDQVSKSAPSGEYIGKGAWMIRGKKNFVKNAKLELSVGVTKEGEIICGPTLSVSSHSVKYAIIRPGWSKKSEVAKKILHKFELNKNDLDKLMQFLPAGETTIVKFI